MKASKLLVECAWEYVLKHNREFPDDPRFVNESDAGPLIDATPQCFAESGLLIHRGHGPGEPCRKFLPDLS